MRYATVAPNGRILGTFTCDPDLLPLRPKPEDAIFIECPIANANNWYWDGNEFVTRQPADITHSVSEHTVTIEGLPDNSTVSVTLPTEYKVFHESQSFSITLPTTGSYILQIDPWPYKRKTFSVLIED